MKHLVRCACISVFFMGLLFLPQANAVPLASAQGGVLAASDGQHSVRLFWFPPVGTWPAGGWRVEAEGRVIKERVLALQQSDLARLSAKDRNLVEKWVGELLRPSAENRTALYAMVGARAMSDIRFASATGLFCELQNIPGGSRRYTVTGLDVNGKATGPMLSSAAVDSAQATPLPPAPRAFVVEPVLNGASISFQPPVMRREQPVVHYQLIRQSGREKVVLDDSRLTRGMWWDSARPVMVDEKVPREVEVEYSLSSVDALGQASTPVKLSVVIPDLSAMQPPALVDAVAHADKIEIVWSATGSEFTDGYALERAVLAGGPYVRLQEKAFSGTKATDDDVIPGTTYFYRVRAMGPRGDLGEPSRVASARALGKRPDPVEGVIGEAGRTRIHLEWKPSGQVVAGYYVERSQINDDNWLRLTPLAVAEARYDDMVNEGQARSFRYRVTAVGRDDQIGLPSTPVTVSLPDLQPPSPPRIDGITGDRGVVLVQFSPAPPENDSMQFLLLRSSSEKGAPIVIGDPIAAAERVAKDASAKSGRVYRYHMVALDTAGNRSELSRPAIVRVGKAPLPDGPVLDVSFRSETVPETLLKFAAPPAGLGVVIQVREPGRDWRTMAGPVFSREGKAALEAIHVNVPRGVNQYRSLIVDEDGEEGEPSSVSTVTRP